MARRIALKQKYGIVSTYSSGKSILDVGCGTGEFLNYCHTQGMSCQGVEPTGKARDFARKSFSLQVDEDFLKKPDQPAQFDVITLWHVLEHIHKLDETMIRIKNELKEDGVLILALPNSNSFDARHYQKYWAAYDLPRHIYHFTKESVELLATTYGFTCQKILPMKMDAFYISLLSEKYKSGSSNWLRAFFTGWRSNLKSGKQDFGHSSQIYILKSKIS